jgi:glycosyltransferase involved in cell wall biosynthesis
VVVQSAAAAHHPRHHYRLAAALQAAGHEVLLLAQPDGAAPGAGLVPVEYLPSRSGRLGRMASGPLTLLRALRRRPAVLYVVSPDLLPWAVVARLVGRCLVVYDSNDDYESLILIKEWLPLPLRRPLGVLVKHLEPRLAACLDAATTALPVTQAKFERAGVRAVLVRNFPPTDRLAGPRPRSRPTVDVLVAGSLEHDQAPLLAETIAALERLGHPRRWLVAVRDCPVHERPALEAILTPPGTQDRIDLRFDVPFLDMPDLLAQARVGFILYGTGPAYAARLPMRIFEYMGAGVPFVAPDLPGVASVVDDEVALLAAPGDPTAYAGALDQLLRQCDRRRRMRARGPELVRERYNWEREATKLTDLFDGLIAGSTGGPPSLRRARRR